MEKSKLIDILKSLSKKELRDLQSFIHSPFYNQNRDVIVLGDYLLKLAPKWASKKLERRYVFAQVHPKKTRLKISTHCFQFGKGSGAFFSV